MRKGLEFIDSHHLTEQNIVHHKQEIKKYFKSIANEKSDQALD